MGRAVYEAANENLKEFLIGATTLSIESLRAQHRRSPPSEIAHWRTAEHAIEYREVERDLSEADLPAFIAGYALSIEYTGWKIFLEQL